jgi:hypothetical protein
VIPIDPIFAQTANLKEPYLVFLEEYGDAELYVADRTPEKFVVRVGRGEPNVQFGYRLMAKRLGYEAERLERAPWADDDPNLYPEKLEGWEAAERELHALDTEGMEDEEWVEEVAPVEAEPEPVVQPVEAEAPVPEVIYGFHLHLPLVIE